MQAALLLGCCRMTAILCVMPFAVIVCLLRFAVQLLALYVYIHLALTEPKSDDTFEAYPAVSNKSWFMTNIRQAVSR